MSNNIQDAIDYAVQICNDETHGYSNGTVRGRTLNPDTDCSGLIYYALQAGGFSVPSSIWYTGNMMDYLRNMGFTEYAFTESQYSQYVPVNGDILVHREGTPEDGHGHAMMYAENVLGFPTNTDSSRVTIAQACIEAVKDYNNAPGDSRYEGTGAYREVWVHNFYPRGLYGGYYWHVFRWGGAPGPTPTPGNPLPIWLMFKMKNNNDLGGVNNGF